MADTDILLRVQADMGDATKRMAELAANVETLSKYEKELKEEIAEATDNFGKESTQVQSLQQQLAEVGETKKAYKKEVSEVSRSVQNAIISDVEYQNTLKGQCALLSQLKDQLRAMPLALDANGNVMKEQSEEYTALQQRIKSLSDSISQQEQAYGQYSRNVGNYAGSIIEAAGKMGGSFGGAVTGIRNATSALQIMSKTPVIGILGLVASVLSKVIEGLKGSEENANRVTKAFGSFKAIGDLLTVGLQTLGEWIGKAAEGIGKLFKRVADRLPQLGQLNERMETRNRLAREEVELNQAQRQSSIDVAENELKVSELRAKASDKDKYSASERLAYLTEALETEKTISQQRYEIALKEYELIRDKNAQTDSSKEELDQEAAAQVKMIEAKRTYYEMERSMQRQIVAAKKEIKAEEKAADDAAKKAAEDALKAQQELAKSYMSLRDKITDTLITDETERQVRSVKKKYNELAVSIRDAVKSGTMSFEEANYYRVALAQQETAEIKEIEAKAANETAAEEERIRAESEAKQLEATEKRLAKQKELNEEYLQDTLSTMNSLNDTMNNLDDRRLSKYEASNDAQKEALEKRLDAGLISEEAYDDAVAELDAELDAKKAEIAQKEAIRERALSVFEIAVNTAKAVMKIWAEVPKADFGVQTSILTALAIAAGAAQSAAVLSEPIPTARKGGLVQGATHEQGGVLINTENDERIIGSEPSKAFPELLNLISYIGKNIPNSGYADRQSVTNVTNTATYGSVDYAAIKAAMTEALQGLKIYTAITDIHDAERQMAKIEATAKM